MGHPDDGVQVLGSPRLSLWFELVSCELLPVPSPELTHVGAGILVHHLGRADVGETVTLEATTASVVRPAGGVHLPGERRRPAGGPRACTTARCSCPADPRRPPVGPV